MLTFLLKGFYSISGATLYISITLDDAADEEEPKVRNTQRLGHSLRETSRSRRCRRDAAFSRLRFHSAARHICTTKWIHGQTAKA